VVLNVGLQEIDPFPDRLFFFVNRQGILPSGPSALVGPQVIAIGRSQPHVPILIELVFGVSQAPFVIIFSLGLRGEGAGDQKAGDQFLHLISFVCANKGQFMVMFFKRYQVGPQLGQNSFFRSSASIPAKPSYSFTISTNRSANLIKLFRMQMVEAFAEFERAILRERTRTGLDAARKEGRNRRSSSKTRTNQQDEIVTIVSAGTKTAADAARLLNVHPAMASRLLARTGSGTMNVKAVV
jgi:hypothetical protein